MKGLYVGILTSGTTSRLRADALASVTDGWDWGRLDTDQLLLATSRLSRSLAFRLRIGRAVTAVNRAVAEVAATNQYDLVWVDKGVYLWPNTVQRLRSCAAKLVHYTPDTAFLNNHSRFFDATAAEYDLLITTKSFERSYYEAIVPADRILWTTQSYDASLHRPRCEFKHKRPEAVFVGLCEPDREACLELLLSANIPLRLGGHGWGRFLKRHGQNPLLSFEGKRVFGDHYAEVLSRARVGLGLVSKRFPELHTTRTFEIPACGTVLATERNAETVQFFAENDVLFFTDYRDLVDILTGIWSSPDKLEAIAHGGREKVRAGGYDNVTVMQRALQRLDLL
jgi:hypothetical protein